MTDDSAKYTGNVASQETDARLLQRVEALLGLSQRPVDHVHALLKGSKLGHGVGDLSRPERVQPFVQAPEPFFSYDFTPSLAQVMRIRRQGGLHAHLDRFERAEGHVGEELG